MLYQLCNRRGSLSPETWDKLQQCVLCTMSPLAEQLVVGALPRISRSPAFISCRSARVSKARFQKWRRKVLLLSLPSQGLRVTEACLPPLSGRPSSLSLEIPMLSQPRGVSEQERGELELQVPVSQGGMRKKSWYS